MLVHLVPVLALATPLPSATEVTHASLVAPHVLELTIRSGAVEHGRQIRYVPLPGDEEVMSGHHRYIKRGDGFLGALVGPKKDTIWTFDRVIARPISPALLHDRDGYGVKVDGMPAAVKGLFRKSRPTDLAMVAHWKFEAPQEHRIYLVLQRPVQEGARVEVTSPAGAKSFRQNAARQRSEAVQVSQIGFRPDDPSKVAFLSTWMGDGGALTYPEGLPFRLVDERDKVVFEGRSKLSRRVQDVDEDALGRSYAKTDVHRLEFGPFRQSGRYRVSVEGIGCSFPFEIGKDVWRRAFVASARSFYHQRSGIALGPPHTTLRRPRNFHPADGVVAHQSTTSLMDSGNGLNALGTDKDNFGNLVRGRTSELVSDAWGGYADAADWDRRIQHLEATRLLLELVIMHPKFVEGVRLNIPESRNRIPDLIDEAVWGLDFYRRLQLPDGGVRGGYEQEEHPRWGEASHQNTLANLVYAPDPWSSYMFAGDAARLAFVLERYDRAKADLFRKHALLAWGWAERDMAKRGNAKLPHQVKDAKNLAAIELYRLTGQESFHEAFKATTAFGPEPKPLSVWQEYDQADAAFVYLNTSRAKDEKLRQGIHDSLIGEASQELSLQGRSSHGIAKANPWLPVGWGRLTSPKTSLARAHFLTQDPDWLKGLVLTCQFGAGANPLNLSYTSGIGSRAVVNWMWLDSRMTNQPAPPGFTVYGPLDPLANPNTFEWGLLKPFTYPDPVSYPAYEAYFDGFWLPNMTEFTVMQSLGPNAYNWGYLAARS